MRIGASRRATRAEILQLPDADGEIPPLVDQVDEPVGQPDVDREARLERGEVRDRRHCLADPEGEGQVEAKRATRLGHRGRRHPFRFLEFAEDALGRAEVALTRLGQGQSPRRPVKDARAKAILDSIDVPGDHRLRHAERPCRSGKAAQRRDPRKDLQTREAIQHLTLSVGDILQSKHIITTEGGA